jgi:hypothetical protein
MNMLILGCLKVADILINPFGNYKVYDFNLASTLELNIWNSSITLENQEMAFYSSLLNNPYRNEEPSEEMGNKESSTSIYLHRLTTNQPTQQYNEETYCPAHFYKGAHHSIYQNQAFYSIIDKTH